MDFNEREIHLHKFIYKDKKNVFTNNQSEQFNASKMESLYK